MRCWIFAAAALAPFAASASAADFAGGFDLAEWHLDSDHSLFIDSTFSYGDDRRKLVAKITAGGSVGKKLDEVDGQLLYSHAIGGGFAVLGGVRHEFVPGPRWTYATLGVEGSAAKGLAVETYAYLSQKGDVTGEMKAVLDIPLAGRCTIQPRAVVSWAAQDVARQGLVAGVTGTELGLRLHYRIADAISPYVGVSHEQLLGRTATLARSAGDSVRATHVVIGLSSSF